MLARRCFALSTVAALCAATIAPLALANSNTSLPGPRLKSRYTLLRVAAPLERRVEQKGTARHGRVQGTFASLQMGAHQAPLATAVAAPQLTEKLDPHACTDPTASCEPFSLLSLGRRLAKYPEPAALSLFGTSLLGIAGVTRRRFFR